MNDGQNQRRVNRVLSRGAQAGIDLLVMLAAYTFAVSLRFEFRHVEIGQWLSPGFLILLCGLQFLALFLCGCYRLVWRYFSIGDLPRMAAAVFLSTALMLGFRLILLHRPELPTIPLSVVIMNGGLFFAGLCGVRILRRAVVEQSSHRQSGEWLDAERAAPRRVLLVGAGSAGVAVVKDLKLHGAGVEVVGYLDDDREKQGASIQGIRVLGGLDDLDRQVQAQRVDEVIVALVRVSRDVIRRVVRQCEQIPIPVRIIPGYFEIVTGSVSVNRIRDVDIEDLLGRDAVSLDVPGLARFIGGNSILITGAGGSIGSELARQVSRFGPSRLLLVERSENAVYEIHREIRASRADLDLVPLVADIADERRIAGILAQYRPQMIVHAAAHKHVPMMEANPCEAIKNNTLGSRCLGELALDAGVERMVLISTDKAVNPTSVMGASKRLAELALQDLNRFGRTRFVAVRFGNVLGSAGSVVPLFREQIRKGGPVTVTHPDMIRYFMTIPEAVGLVLQAAAMADGGEIFVLDMGDPVKIVDLAEDMIRLSGLKPREDIQIVFTGIRPGEKLFEELGTSEDQTAKTRHPRVLIGKIPTQPSDEIAAMLRRFRELCDREAGSGEIRGAIRAALPESLLK